MSSAPWQAAAGATGGGLKLELGHSCYRELTWDCILEARGAAARLASGLPARGYVETSDNPFVRVFDNPEHHCVVVVPRTGRVQIRVHYLTRAEDRADAAARVADVLADVLRTPVQ